MKNGTNFDNTETALGQMAADGQFINRVAFIGLMLSRSIVGLATLLAISLAFSTYSASFGYANIMFTSKLMSASTSLGLPVTATEVIASAWSHSWIEGWALMGVCSACIILFGLLPTAGTKFSNVSKWAVAFEALIGSAGYMLDSYAKLGVSTDFFMQFGVQSFLRTFVPVLVHWIVGWIRLEYGSRIDVAYERIMKRLDQDFELV